MSWQSKHVFHVYLFTFISILLPKRSCVPTLINWNVGYQSRLNSMTVDFHTKKVSRNSPVRLIIKTNKSVRGNPHSPTVECCFRRKNVVASNTQNSQFCLLNTPLIWHAEPSKAILNVLLQMFCELIYTKLLAFQFPCFIYFLT